MSEGQLNATIKKGRSCPPVFLTEDEIVGVLLFIDMPGMADIENFRQTPAGDLYKFHHGFGTYVRNKFHLWHEQNPYTMLGYVPDVRDGADYGVRHPDAMSMRIIEKLHARLTLETK